MLVAERAGPILGLVVAVETWAHQRGLEEVTVRNAIARAESHPFYVTPPTEGRMGCRTMGHHRRLAGPSPA